MDKILQIYKRDIKKIITNAPLMITIAGLIIVPALYAWINIIASWDPYGNTKNLLVAIVNNDEGAEFEDIKINVGNEVVDKLKKNQNIGWTFVNEQEAEKGVKYGKYYASIAIPKDFSKNLLSIATSQTPQKAKLVYSVNEKINAIAPKITKSGLTSLQNEITSSLTQESSRTVLTYLNAYGFELEKAKPEMEKLMDLMVTIEKDLPRIGENINNAYELTKDMHSYIQTIQADIPIITDTLNKAIGVAKSNNEFLDETNNILQNIPSYIRLDLALTKNRCDATIKDLNSINNSLSAGMSGQQKSLQLISDKLNNGIEHLNNTINIMNSLNNILDDRAIYNFINNLQNIKSQLVQESTNINSFIEALNKGEKISSNAIKLMIQGISSASQGIDRALDGFEAISIPINDLIDNSIDITENGLRILKNAQGNMPLINSLLKDAEIGTGLGIMQMKNIKDKFPDIQQSISATVDKLEGLNEEQRFNEIVNLLQRNAKSVSDFLSNPIDLVQNRVFPIPNYGSAMAPFYTTLAIWVGAFTLLSLLSIKVKPLKENEIIGAREEFFGRYLIFATITMIQAFVITVGNLFFLKTYAVSPIIFLIFSIYVGIVFSMIVYTLVSVFGNVGKALALVIMVLQVSASGGTFPIELTPKFFQNINPLLPFTYAIRGMREAEGGIIFSTLYKNIAILGIYFFGAILIAVFLKEKINEKSEKFIKKIKESGLIGE